MNRFLTRQSFLKNNIIAMIGVLLCGYFSYHAISGERSLIRLISLNHAIEKNVANKKNAIQERQIIESKVHAMRPGSVEKDLLEERVRVVLRFQHPDEITVMRN